MTTIAGRRFRKTVPAIFITLFITTLMAATVWGAASDYYGNYSGSFTGDDSGLWLGVLDASDMAFLSYSPPDDYDGGELFFNSENGSLGTFSSTSEMFGTNISVQIDASDGSVTGTFSNASSEDSGTLSGSKITSSPLAGSYSGSISGGGASGTWSMTIASDGALTGSVTADGSTDAFKGAAHSQGYFAAIGDDFVFFGQVSGGSISGEWFADDGAEGTLSGSSGGGGGGGAGDSGGGGCFIFSLIK